MTGSIQEKNGKLYAVLSYRGSDGTPKRKWVSTGLAVRGNKKKAESMLQDIIEAHLELEETESEAVLFVDYLKEWLMKKKTESSVIHLGRIRNICHQTHHSLF